MRIIAVLLILLSIIGAITAETMFGVITWSIIWLGGVIIGCTSVICDQFKKLQRVPT